MSDSVGTVSQIIGPVVDVTFSGEDNALPKIYDSLEISIRMAPNWCLKYNLIFERIL